MLTKGETQRYFRQLILDEFGEEAQLKIKKARVLIIGAGGLGGPASLYLVAAGVGNIVICDRDVVELSNLNRQILHSTNDLNRPKSDSAHEKLSALNPDINIETHVVTIDDSNIADFALGCDIIVDCLDNIKTRLIVNEFAIGAGIPIMHAGIDGWTGQLTLVKPKETACLKCLYGNSIDTIDAKPVIGAMAGVVGATQAMETLKYLAGVGELLENKLAFYDSFNMEWVKLSISKNENCSVCS